MKNAKSAQQTATLNLDQSFQQAYAYQRAGRLYEAGKRYQDILQSYPDNLEANYHMGALAVQMKQPEAGLPYFIAALDADPTKGQYWSGYIDALIQANQLNTAQHVLALAQQHGLQGEDVDALVVRLKGEAQAAGLYALRESPAFSSAATQDDMKMPAAQTARSDMAARKSRISLEVKPSIQEINMLVDMFTDWRYTEAAALARTMTVRFPLHEFGWKALGAVLKQLGRSADALTPMQKAADLSPDDVEAHYNLGVTLQDLERPAEAELSYRRALLINPDYAQAHSNLGVILHDLGRLEEAETSYRRALQINPNDAAAHSNLGVNLHDLGRLAEAEISLRRGLEINPDDAMAHSNLGNTLQSLGRLDEACANYRRALQIRPNYADAHYNLGNTFRELGQADEAEASYRRALTIKPDFVDAHYNLANTLQGLCRLDEAETSYRRALQIKPDYAQAHYNLGNTINELGRSDEAAACYRQALKIEPDFAEAHYNLGNTLKELCRPDEAEASYRRALQIKQDLAEAYCNLGATLNDLHRLDEAEVNYRRALQIKPDYAEAHDNLGNILCDLGRLDEAEASYRRALQIKPDFAEAHCNLGATLQDLKRPDEAEICYRRALQIKPDLADAHYNLGNTLKDLGRLVEAEASLQRALLIKPDHANAYNNLGIVLHGLDRLDESEVSLRQALKIRPDYAEAHSNLGNSLKDMGLLNEAEGSYRSALQIKPDLAEAHSNLGITLMDMGRLAEAETCCRQSLKLRPEYAPAHQNLSTLSAYLSDFDLVVMESDIALNLNPDSAMAWEQRLYAFSYHPDLTALEIYTEFVRWGDRFTDPVVDFSAHDRTPSRRLKIGYVSPDFRRHTSRFFFWPLFANHDHAVVELYAYSNVRLEDDVTLKFKGLFEHWRNIRGVSDSDVANMIREDGIDILIDGCSHMRDDRLGVFTLKPAPIQATWLGAAWTTGLKTMDYALIDPHMAPIGTLTRETIVRMPHCFVAYQPPEETAEIAPPPCLKNGYITFGYTGRTERLNHHTFTVWGKILRENPTARLILDFRPFADPYTQDHYRQFMNRHGVDISRVTMRNSENIFAGLNDIDILLDCFPHSGGTMLFDALWMGVPVLTLAGRPPVGRIGSTLMINLDLPEWVANSQEEYIAKACTLMQDQLALAQLRAGMRVHMQNSPLMDGPGFARAMEASYREMFEKWAKGTNEYGDETGKESEHS